MGHLRSMKLITARVDVTIRNKTFWTPFFHQNCQVGH